MKINKKNRVLMILIATHHSLAYSATILNPDGFSTDSALPAGSGSATIGFGNSISPGGHGNGTAGGNLLHGSNNYAMSSDSVFISGIANSVAYQEGTAVFGFYNTMTFSSEALGQANVILGYSNGITAGPSGFTWGAIMLGTENQSSSSDSWIFGKGNIGQVETVTLGKYAEPVADTALIVGTGIDAINRSNGMVVYRNGNLYSGGNVTLKSGSAIYFGSSTTATLSASANGSAIFPGQVTLQNGLQISNGSLSLATATPSSSSATGALIVTGGIGVSLDSWFNGVRVGKGNGSVLSNTAIGNSALAVNSSGSNNTAVGMNAMVSNVSGSSNTAVGTNSLNMNTGSGNSAFGSFALRNNTAGTGNTGFGVNALVSNTTGTFNTCVGLNSLYYNTSGMNNSVLGKLALYNNSIGLNNIAIGAHAGQFQSNGSSALTDPENSIYIGSNSRGKDNNDDNSIVIGYSAIGEGANTTVIGNNGTLRTRIHGSAQLAGGTANGSSSVAMSGGTSQMPNSTAMSGGGAYGTYATAISGGIVHGSYATAVSNGLAFGTYSTAAAGGYAIGDNSFAAGNYAQADTYCSAAFGRYAPPANLPGSSATSWVETDPVFQIGNGTAPTATQGSTALKILKNGHTTLTNKAWKENAGAPLTDPVSTTDSGGNALVVDGHTILNGKVVISVPQGDISMGIYGEN